MHFIHINIKFILFTIQPERTNNNMASKDKEKKKKKDLNKPKKSKKKLIFIIIFLLLILIGGGVTYFFLNKGKEVYKPINSEFFEIPQKTDEFIYSKNRDAHKEIKTINNEIQIITQETLRVTEIEKEYPDQKKITDKAITKYNKLKSDSIKNLNKVIIKFNDLYVQFSVNPDVGTEILNKESEKISGDLNKIITGLNKETQMILKNRPVKLSLVDKVKSKFKKSED